ncbi:MAG TPA: RICIN domain-containing protein [Phytomonospora sp.]
MLNGRWKPEDDAPARFGRMWTKTRSGAGSARTVAIAASLVVLVLVVTVVVALLNSGTGDADTADGPPSHTPSASVPKQDFPADGAYELKTVHSGLCAATGPEPGNPDRIVLVQEACAGKPNLLLAKVDKGRFRFRLAEPDYPGKECLAVDEPGTEAGLLFAAWACDVAPGQVFQLRAVGDGFFQIEIPAGEMCLDVIGQGVAAGTQFDTEPCADGVPSQRFQFISG